jgi:hypothetical protein
MGYHQVFREAVEAWAADYECGAHRLYTEADFQSHLFYHLMRLMVAQGFAQPYQIHVNYSIHSVREKIDLVLGENEVLAELKFEPDYLELAPSRRPVVFTEDIAKDIDRMRRYAQQGYPHCYVLALDEAGIHYRAFADYKWRVLRQGEREVYLLMHAFNSDAPDNHREEPGV